MPSGPLILVSIFIALASAALIGAAVLAAKKMTVVQADAALRKRSRTAWIAFRVVAGTMAALGLFMWVGLWFQRGFWLGVSMAVMCVSVLANELGLLRPRSRAQ